MHCASAFPQNLMKLSIFLYGSAYFTAKILAATDQLDLLCRQSNIRSRGMIG